MSARRTGRPVSSASSFSILFSRAPPPVRTMPRSAISEPNSGGVCSKADLRALAIDWSGSWSASRISLLLRVNVLGTPSDKFLPLTEISLTASPGYALPISCLIFSAVASPINIP